MSDPGLFGPGSLTWRINGEMAMVLGGGRALILQVAHPQVGAGVERHSRYAADRWGRLTHTLDTMGQILFGDLEAAMRSAERMRRAHRRVEGTVPEGRSAGQRYCAGDAALVLWVWATLVDTSLLVYQRYVCPLNGWEISRYYEEQKRFAEVCGISSEACPATYSAFRRYFDAVVDDELEATPAARHVARMVCNPLSLPRAAAPVIGVLALATSGLLPPALRAELGMTWAPRHEWGMWALSFGVGRMLPLLPERVRRVRSARRASARVRGSAPAI